MSEQLITINPGDSLPGFPVGHGPGLYLVDFEARTIRPAPIAVEEPQPIPEPQPVEEAPVEAPIETIEEG